MGSNYGNWAISQVASQDNAGTRQATKSGAGDGNRTHTGGASGAEKTSALARWRIPRVISVRIFALLGATWDYVRQLLDRDRLTAVSRL
jgi:hypothetical protein